MTKLEEVVELMEVDDEQEILGISRLNQFRDGNKQPSSAIRVDFKVIPKNIWIGLLYFHGWPYVLPPLRCYRCQRFRHIASGCMASPRCLVGSYVPEAIQLEMAAMQW
jgi:hypothetical protein